MEIGSCEVIKCLKIQREVVDPDEQIKHIDLGLDPQTPDLCPFWILESLILLVANGKQHFSILAYIQNFLNASIWSLLHFYGFFIIAF